MAINHNRSQAVQTASPWAPTSIPLDIATWALPAALASTAAYAASWALGHPTQYIVGANVIWTAGLLVWGWEIVPEQTWVVVERFGGCYAVKFRRLRWLNPFFDRIRERGSLMARRMKLYITGSKEAKLDFKDASADIDAEVWLHIGDPEMVAMKRWEPVAQDVLLWVYGCDDPEGLATGAIDHELRPRLQNTTIAEASINATAICEEAIAEAQPALLGLGLYPNKSGKTLLLKDIDLPQAIQDIREELLKGEYNALKNKAQYRGVMMAVQAIMDEAKKGGDPVTYEMALDQVFRQMLFETFKEMKGNFNFIGSDLMKIFESVMNNMSNGGRP